MKNIKKIVDNKIFSVILIVLISVLCSLYFYSQLIHIEVPIHSDDAGMAVDFRGVIDFGVPMSLSRKLNIFVWIYYMLYCLFGCTELFLQIGFTVNFFFCCAFSLFLSLSNEKNEHINWEYVFLFVFLVALPGNFGLCSIHPLKFHTAPLICFFVILLDAHAIMCRKNKRIKWSDILILLCAGMTAIIAVDILFFVMAVGPAFIYLGCRFIQSGGIKRHLKKILITLSIILICARFVLSNFDYNGYGSRVFSSPEDIVHNIGMGIRGVLLMFNIPIIGENILQASTFVYMIRLFFVCCAIGIVICNCYNFICQKKKVEVIDIILSLSVVCNILAYIMSGKQEDEISVRYMMSIYYTLVIVLLRFLGEWKWNKNEIFSSSFQRKCYIYLFCIVCIISLIQPLELKRDWNKTDEYCETIIKTNGIEYGLGEFWSANVVNVLSESQNFVQAVTLDESGFKPYLNVWEPYFMGSYMFNFFVDSTEQNNDNYYFGEDKIKEVYGNPIEFIGSDNRNIYVYDYDIRFPKKYLNSDTLKINTNDRGTVDSDDIILKGGGEVTFSGCSFFTGTYKLTVKGENIEKIVLNSNIEDDLFNCKVVRRNTKEIVYQFDVKGKLDDVALIFMNEGNKAKIKECEIVVLKAAEDIEFMEKSNVKIGKAMMAEGVYDICFLGSNIKGLKISCKQNNEIIDAIKVKEGNERITYKIEVPESGEVTISVEGKSFDRCSYETPYEMRNEEEKVQYFDVDRIFSNIEHKKIQNKSISLKNGELTYGPYVTLNRGNYLLYILGQNLDKAQIRFTADKGDISIEKEVYNVSLESEKAIFGLNIENEVEDFEIVVENFDTSIIQVNQYIIESVGPATIYTSENGLIPNKAKDNKEQEIILNKGEYIYGPYIPLEKGTYQCDIYGNGIKKLDVTATYDSGQKEQKIDIVSRSDGKVRIKFTLDENVELFEVIAKNNDEEEIKVGKYKFIKLN